MITDQKTQNRLHATRGNVLNLFSIRQRKEAVKADASDILKERPEYLQVMNHIPGLWLRMRHVRNGGNRKNRKI